MCGGEKSVKEERKEDKQGSLYVLCLSQSQHLRLIVDGFASGERAHD